MRTLTVRAQVNKRGLVTLRMPRELADREVDLVIVYEQVDQMAKEGEPPAAGNWPAGFYAATAGAWQGEPLLRERECCHETRNALP